MASKNAVAKIGNSLPTERPSWMGNTSRGNEGVTAEDMTIPRLSIIQDLSPQHKKSKPEYIEGSEVKMIFNTATQELYGEQVVVVPVLFRKEWVIWKSLKEGGGFRGAAPTEREALEILSGLEDAAQCEVVDTHQHFVLVIPMNTPVVDMAKAARPAVISMSKSQCKPSRAWNSIIQAAGGDRFERCYRLSVVDDKNTAGNEYYNWQIKPMGYVDEEVFKLAEDLYNTIRSGAMDVKRDRDPPTEPHASGDIDGDDSEF